FWFLWSVDKVSVRKRGRGEEELREDVKRLERRIEGIFWHEFKFGVVATLNAWADERNGCEGKDEIEQKKLRVWGWDDVVGK
ncbi:unnamed protein product, partial [Allacma fusca]